jgi:hypothetical protein
MEFRRGMEASFVSGSTRGGAGVSTCDDMG